MHKEDTLTSQWRHWDVSMAKKNVSNISKSECHQQTFKLTLHTLDLNQHVTHRLQGILDLDVQYIVTFNSLAVNMWE